MKINLTKLLFIDNRITHINKSEPGTTGDTSYLPQRRTTSGDLSYSFVLDFKKAVEVN